VEGGGSIQQEATTMARFLVYEWTSR